MPQLDASLYGECQAALMNSKRSLCKSSATGTHRLLARLDQRIIDLRTGFEAMQEIKH